MSPRKLNPEAHQQASAIVTQVQLVRLALPPNSLQLGPMRAFPYTFLWTQNFSAEGDHSTREKQTNWSQRAATDSLVHFSKQVISLSTCKQPNGLLKPT